MLDRRVIEFVVNCPLRPFSKYKMWLEFVMWNGGWFPLPCNGCDMLGGDPVCQECCAALTLMFYHDPDIDVSNPVSPKLSLVRDK